MIPLHGTELSCSKDGTVATLDFSNSETAKRALRICRMAQSQVDFFPSMSQTQVAELTAMLVRFHACVLGACAKDFADRQAVPGLVIHSGDCSIPPISIPTLRWMMERTLHGPITMTC